MRFTATDVFDYYKPSKCVRRVALRAREVPEQETDTSFMNLLRNLGLAHEAEHLASLAGVVSVAKGDPEDRERRTLEAIRSGAAVVFQPRFRVGVSLGGEPCELVGEPDFLVRAPGGAGYFVRDSKLARNVLSSRHEGIQRQLQVYGLLFERAVGKPPAGLEVHAGTGDIVRVAYDGDAAVLASLDEQRRMRAASPDLYEPVGWTKCKGCGYEARCASEARAAEDVALLTTVNLERARELHARGIGKIGQIAAAVDDPAHHDYFWTGKKKPVHKSFVAGLLRSAEAYLSKADIPIAAPALPSASHFAMFDLEGLPPYIDDLEKVYLWGLKVFGQRPSGYLPAQAGMGADGDREGWFAFLGVAERLLAEYGSDLPFVHWSNHEKDKVRKYVERYGDPAGVAARVLENLVDLLSVTKASVVTPLPSYGLKTLEGHVGFRRRLTEANGAWSIASYIEATECDDPVARERIVGQILAYNEEDLDATWAVLQWLQRLPA